MRKAPADLLNYGAKRRKRPAAFLRRFALRNEIPASGVERPAIENRGHSCRALTKWASSLFFRVRANFTAIVLRLSHHQIPPVHCGKSSQKDLNAFSLALRFPRRLTTSPSRLLERKSTKASRPPSAKKAGTHPPRNVRAHNRQVLRGGIFTMCRQCRSAPTKTGVNRNEPKGAPIRESIYGISCSFFSIANAFSLLGGGVSRPPNEGKKREKRKKFFFYF